jgi:hypothetical protein
MKRIDCDKSPQLPQKRLLTSFRADVIDKAMRSSLTATEFSRIIQKDKKTVIRWVQQGFIPGAKRVGHVYQIPLQEVEVFQSVSEYPPKKWQK